MRRRQAWLTCRHQRRYSTFHRARGFHDREWCLSRPRTQGSRHCTGAIRGNRGRSFGIGDFQSRQACQLYGIAVPSPVPATVVMLPVVQLDLANSEVAVVRDKQFLSERAAYRNGLWVRQLCVCGRTIVAGITPSVPFPAIVLMSAVGESITRMRWLVVSAIYGPATSNGSDNKARLGGSTITAKSNDTQTAARDQSPSSRCCLVSRHGCSPYPRPTSTWVRSHRCRLRLLLAGRADRRLRLRSSARRD